MICRQEREAEKERKKKEKYEQKKREKIQKIHCKYEVDSVLFVTVVLLLHDCWYVGCFCFSLLVFLVFTCAANAEYDFFL